MTEINQQKETIDYSDFDGRTFFIRPLASSRNGVVFDVINDDNTDHAMVTNLTLDTAKGMIEALQGAVYEIENPPLVVDGSELYVGELSSTPENLILELEDTAPQTVVLNVAPGTQIVLNTTGE